MLVFKEREREKYQEEASSFAVPLGHFSVGFGRKGGRPIYLKVGWGVGPKLGEVVITQTTASGSL